MRGECASVPGAVDVHVHFQRAGAYRLGSGGARSAAAAAAGTTTVIEMPLNAHPPTLERTGLSTPNGRQPKQSSIVDFALWEGLTPDEASTAHGELAARGAIVFKAFMSNSRRRRFPRRRRRDAVRGNAARGEAGSPGGRPRQERRAHRVARRACDL